MRKARLFANMRAHNSARARSNVRPSLGQRAQIAHAKEVGAGVLADGAERTVMRPRADARVVDQRRRSTRVGY